MSFSFLLHNFFTLTITGLVNGSIYALIALGYTLVYGVLRLINFAHSEVWMWGSFAVVWSLVSFHVGPTTGVAVVLVMVLVALIAAMATSGVVALVVERVAYRRLQRIGAPPLIALISAIGASFVLGEIMGLRDRIVGWVGLSGALKSFIGSARDTPGFESPIEPVRVFGVGDYTVSNIDLMVFFAAILMMVLLDQFIRRSRLGRGIRAVAQDSESAALMGVDKVRVVQLTFFIGGMMAGAAALLYMLKFGVTRWNIGFAYGIKAFTAAVMGGIGNIRGALLGGLVLGIAENYASAVLGSDWADRAAFFLLVIILLFRPTGLLGESLGKARV